MSKKKALPYPRGNGEESAGIGNEDDAAGARDVEGCGAAQTERDFRIDPLQGLGYPVVLTGAPR